MFECIYPVNLPLTRRLLFAAAMRDKVGTSKGEMQVEIRINRDKAFAASEELMGLSRIIRQNQGEVEKVREQLRRLSELDRCRTELENQEEAMALLAARLVSLSASMAEIVRVFSRAESRSAENLEK